MKFKKALWALGMACALWAADPWKNTDYTQWSSEDAKKLLTKSPWAKDVTVSMGQSASPGGGGGGSRRGGGGGGGGMGGGGMDSGMGGGGGGGMGWRQPRRGRHGRGRRHRHPQWPPRPCT